MERRLQFVDVADLLAALAAFGAISGCVFTAPHFRLIGVACRHCVGDGLVPATARRNLSGTRLTVRASAPARSCVRFAATVGASTREPQRFAIFRPFWLVVVRSGCRGERI